MPDRQTDRVLIGEPSPLRWPDEPVRPGERLSARGWRGFEQRLDSYGRALAAAGGDATKIYEIKLERSSEG